MDQKTIILHGWSDCSGSFAGIKKMLVAQGLGDVHSILYGDYESREDNVTFNDVADGLNDRLVEMGLISADGKRKCELNVIVHSTGGLVIRHWISRYYLRDGKLSPDCPVKRIVMLAPANFGSPLAHRGKSFVGGIFKGRWKVGDFMEVGRELLSGLELASPYQWWLANQDLIIEKPFYNRDEIQLTILVGIDDYRGARGWVNKPGTDGTVVIAGTAMDSAKLVLDFCEPRRADDDYVPCRWEYTNPADDFAFAVIDHADHGSIVEQAAMGPQTTAGDLLVRALQAASPAKFADLCHNCESVTQATYLHRGDKSRYQQFLFHAVDDYGISIRDFMVEFLVRRSERTMGGGLLSMSRMSRDEDRWSERIHAAMMGETHAHTVDASFRRLLVDWHAVIGELELAAKELGPVVLGMRVSVPAVDRGIEYDLKCLQNIVIERYPAEEKCLSFFYENTTTLIELRINRRNRYVTLGTNPRKH